MRAAHAAAMAAVVCCVCGCAASRGAQDMRVGVVRFDTAGYAMHAGVRDGTLGELLGERLEKALRRRRFETVRLEEKPERAEAVPVVITGHVALANYNIDGALIAGMASVEITGHVEMERAGERAFSGDYEASSAVIVPQPFATFVVLSGRSPIEGPTRRAVSAMASAMARDIQGVLRAPAGAEGED